MNDVFQNMSEQRRGICKRRSCFTNPSQQHINSRKQESKNARRRIPGDNSRLCYSDLMKWNAQEHIGRSFRGYLFDNEATGYCVGGFQRPSMSWGEFKAFRMADYDLYSQLSNIMEVLY